jgi:hypothetical protein
VRKVDDKRVHKVLAALAIGGPAGSNAEMMGLLELVDGLKRFGNEPAQRIAFRNQPLANPSVTGGDRPERFLCSTGANLSEVCQRTLLDAPPLSLTERGPLGY